MSSKVRTLSLNGDRKIRIMESGVEDGVPIMVHSGAPGSIIIHPSWAEDARTKGIRLISYDRPGYGGSTSHPGRSVARAADDVAAIAQQLELDRLSVWGISGGGPVRVLPGQGTDDR